MNDDRLEKLEGRKRGETVTVVVVEDENFYGNAQRTCPSRLPTS
jgi:hypothetical protein